MDAAATALDDLSLCSLGSGTHWLEPEGEILVTSRQRGRVNLVGWSFVGWSLVGWSLVSRGLVRGGAVRKRWCWRWDRSGAEWTSSSYLVVACNIRGFSLGNTCYWNAERNLTSGVTSGTKTCT